MRATIFQCIIVLSFFLVICETRLICKSRYEIFPVYYIDIDTIATHVIHTGCCKTSGQLCKLLCDSFLRIFFLFFCSFDCQIWAIFHSGTLWPWEWIFFVENIIMKKCKISGLAQIGSFFPGWILRVANFGVNYLRHFFINFKNSCAHLAPIFLNFP